MERRKPPLKPRRVMADELAVDVDGETYYPHVGEWVEFKGRPSLGLYLEMTKLAESTEGLVRLLQYIHAWTLTDDEGNAYPLELASLMRMPKEEIAWLLSSCELPGVSESESKNGLTPSTSL